MWSLFLTLWLVVGCGSSSTIFEPPPPSVSVDGRARLLSLTDGGVVAAIDGLGADRSAQIYASVAGWSEEAPSLTGTLAQAGAAMEALVDRPEFGALTVAAVVAELSPPSAQAFLIGLAGTAGVQDETAVPRARDAMTALTAPLEEAPLDEMVGRSLVDLESLTELNGLRILELTQLPERKREGVKLARLSVPAPNPGQTIQKVIKLADLERYLSGEFQPTVGGSVAFYEQVAFLRTPAELIAGLRLDYPGGFQGQTRVGALIFPLPEAMPLKIPFGEALGGAPAAGLVYPFTGSGFTATVRARLVPELTLVSTERQPLPVGAQLFEIDEAGTRHLRGTLDPLGDWVVAQEQLVPRAELVSP